MNKIVPVFDNNNCIILSSNNGFIPATSVLIQSIIEYSNDENTYDIIILHKDISKFSQKNIINMVNKANISIRFVEIEPYIKGTKFYTANRNSLTEETYFRLFSPWILSDLYEKALYLDADMIVRTDIQELIDTCIDKHLICAVRDYWGICNYERPNDKTRQYREELGINNVYDYIIAGMILFNLSLFREQYSLDYVLNLCTAKNWVQHDQDVINILANNSIVHVGPEWGYVSDYGYNCYLPIEMQNEINAIMKDPKIVHYAGGRKPWKKRYDEFCIDFWVLASKTPYFADLLGKVKSIEYKNYIVHNISNIELDTIVKSNGVHYYYKGILLERMEHPFMKYQFIDINDKNLILEGTVAVHNATEKTPMEIFILVNGTKVSPSIQIDKFGYEKKSNLLVSRGKWFSLSYDLSSISDELNIQIGYKLNEDYEFIIQKIGFDKYAPFNGKIGREYLSSDGWIVTRYSKGIKVIPATKSEIKQKEFNLIKYLLKSREKAKIKAGFTRLLVNFIKPRIKKPIWLISDRISWADDNGEAFFKYVSEKGKNEIDAYFLIKKGTPTYERLKQYGKVISPYSWKHKLLQLLATLSISSQTDEVYRNPFWKNGYLYQDLLAKVKYVFLQHGIITNDLSDWLNKRNQQMSGFIVSSHDEYDKVLHGDYNYTSDEVWLTGLARFDCLEDKKEKCITFQPTWRKYLALRQDKDTGIWILKPNFYHSAYATFYREVLTNERLRAKAKELGYRIQFKIHPSFLSHEKEFGFDDKVEIVPADKSYNRIYSESSLLISDYSSSILDFLYLRKPIIYCQFDFEEFFSGGHMYKQGDMDYENKGFGEVEKTVEGAVDRIIEYMENDCQLKPKYRERVDRFFAYNDKDNCKRIYDKCKSLS